MTIEQIGQIIGIIAMIIAVSSYQCKHQRTLILVQLVGAALFSINYFAVGAIEGGLINAVCIFRSIVFANKKFFRADKPIWVGVFAAIFIGCTVLSFTTFGTALTVPNVLLSLLPVIGMTASTVGFFMKDAKAVRRCGMIHSPAWLLYSSINFSLGGILCEVFSIISIVTAMIRLDRKPKAS